MADNDVIINPDNPEPTPPPAPAPEPKSGLTADELKRDLDTVLKVLQGVEGFLPSGPKAALDKLVVILTVAKSQDWLFDVLVDVLHRFSGTSQQASPDQFRQAVFEALVKRGEKVAQEQSAK